mmetsp:Transcript_2790/g.7666  ORF Transcript_2790/g.7666 Transcript_2790/m.7666 type:complete len:619 (-) Transcript_2790:128-1984(-)
MMDKRRLYVIDLLEHENYEEIHLSNLHRSLFFLFRSVRRFEVFAAGREVAAFEKKSRGRNARLQLLLLRRLPGVRLGDFLALDRRGTIAGGEFVDLRVDVAIDDDRGQDLAAFQRNRGGGGRISRLSRSDRPKLVAVVALGEGVRLAGFQVRLDDVKPVARFLGLRVDVHDVDVVLDENELAGHRVADADVVSEPDEDLVEAALLILDILRVLVVEFIGRAVVKAFLVLLLHAFRILLVEVIRRVVVKVFLVFVDVVRMIILGVFRVFFVEFPLEFRLLVFLIGVGVVVFLLLLLFVVLVVSVQHRIVHVEEEDHRVPRSGLEGRHGVPHGVVVDQGVPGGQLGKDHVRGVSLCEGVDPLVRVLVALQVGNAVPLRTAEEIVFGVGVPLGVHLDCRSDVEDPAAGVVVVQGDVHGEHVGVEVRDQRVPEGVGGVLAVEDPPEAGQPVGGLVREEHPVQDVVALVLDEPLDFRDVRLEEVVDLRLVDRPVLVHHVDRLAAVVLVLGELLLVDAVVFHGEAGGLAQLDDPLTDRQRKDVRVLPYVRLDVSRVAVAFPPRPVAFLKGHVGERRWCRRDNDGGKEDQARDPPGKHLRKHRSFRAFWVVHGSVFGRHRRRRRC